MDVMGYIFMAATLIVLAVGGWVLYQDHKAADRRSLIGPNNYGGTFSF